MKTKDFEKVVDFQVLDYLFCRGFADIENFAAQREDAVSVATDNSQTGDSQGFGAVSLRQNQRAGVRVLRTLKRQRTNSVRQVGQEKRGN